MLRGLAVFVLLLQAATATALAQGVIQLQELPPLPPAPAAPAPVLAPQQSVPARQRDPIAAGPVPGTAVAPLPATPAPPAAEAESGRVFCDQNVSFRVASPDVVPEQYRPFIGIFSDASWTPQLCAALIVQNVQPDGTASVVYAYGPMGTSARGAGGILNGTGIVRDGELR